MNKKTVVFVAFFSMLIIGCRTGAPPYLGSSAAMTYESYSEKGDLDFAATKVGIWRKHSSSVDESNVANVFYGTYQFDRRGFIGIGYENGYLIDKRLFDGLDDVGGIDMVFGKFGVQHSFSNCYTRNSFQYGYGQLVSKAYILDSDELIPQGSLNAGVHRLMLKSIIGIRWAHYEGNIGLRYFYNRFSNVHGDMVYKGVNYVDKVKNNPYIHVVVPELSLAANYQFATVFCQFSVKNLIPTDYKYFYDNSGYVSIGIKLRVNVLEEYKEW